MNPPDQKWQRLVEAARRPAEDVTAPYGFATRVAAQAFAVRPAGSLLERFALRALGVACLFAVLGVVSNYTLISDSATAAEDAFFTTEDPVSILLDVT